MQSHAHRAVLHANVDEHVNKFCDGEARCHDEHQPHRRGIADKIADKIDRCTYAEADANGCVNVKFCLSDIQRSRVHRGRITLCLCGLVCCAARP